MSASTKGIQKYLTERRIFLFDQLIVLCKSNPLYSAKKSPHNSFTVSSAPEFKYKEKFQIRKIEVIDIRDTDGSLALIPVHLWISVIIVRCCYLELKNAFEIRSNDKDARSVNHVILFAKSAEEKQSWMCALVTLQNRKLAIVLSQLSWYVPFCLFR